MLEDNAALSLFGSIDDHQVGQFANSPRFVKIVNHRHPKSNFHEHCWVLWYRANLPPNSVK